MSGFVSLKTAGLAIGLAVGAGVFLQYGATASSPAVAPADTAVTQPRAAVANNVGRIIFGMPAMDVPPADHHARARSMVPLPATSPEPDAPRFDAVTAMPSNDCAAKISLRPVTDALVDFTANLPCARKQEVVIKHSVLAFSAITDDDGYIHYLIPALEEDASFSILVDNVEHGTARISVPDLRAVDRVVLQWRGRENLQLHAFESGAGIGDAGHIWSASAPDSTGQRGFVDRLGLIGSDMPQMAEVFTRLSRNDGDGLALQVGIALTMNNCGQGINATTHQINSGEWTTSQKLSLILPGCDAAGTIVMVDDHFANAAAAAR